MIQYNRGCIATVGRFCHLHGSVFPRSFLVALPCGVVTALLKYLIDEGFLPALSAEGSKSILKDNSCWSGLFFLVGFLIIFRTSQAYSRFCAGCTSANQMRAEWFDACAALVAFCKCSTANPETVHEFQHILVRLFSILHAVALADIEDSRHDNIEAVQAFKYELVDGEGIDAESLQSIKTSPAKVELVFQWIQQLIVENLDTGVLTIPAPILSRTFQEIGNGMLAFNECMTLSSTPFPFPYMQTCECLLMVHWVVTPLVVSQYVSSPWWAGLFSFLQVFIYWSLNAIAIEIENPFGMDANDLPASQMQKVMNRHLVLLLDPATLRTPRLVNPCKGGVAIPTLAASSSSLSQIWNKTCPEAGNPTRRLSICSMEVSLNPVADLVRDDIPSSKGKLSQESQEGVASCMDRVLTESSQGVPTQDWPRIVQDMHGGSIMHLNLVEGNWGAQSYPHTLHSEGQYALGASNNNCDESAAWGACVTQPLRPSLSCTLPPSGHVLPPFEADSLIVQKSAVPASDCYAI